MSTPLVGLSLATGGEDLVVKDLEQPFLIHIPHNDVEGPIVITLFANGSEPSFTHTQDLDNPSAEVAVVIDDLQGATTISLAAAMNHRPNMTEDLVAVLPNQDMSPDDPERWKTVFSARDLKIDDSQNNTLYITGTPTGMCYLIFIHLGMKYISTSNLTRFNNDKMCC